MAFYCRTKRVGEHPDPILALEHNLDFANDADVNAMIERRYRLYDYLTPDDYANTMILQSVIDQWHEYINKIYATTQYEYDPILNYDRHEEGKEITARHKGSKRSIATDVKTSTNTDRTDTETPRVQHTRENTGYGLGSSATGTPNGKTVDEDTAGTNELHVSGTAANNYSQQVGNAANNYETVQDIDANTYDKDELSFEDRRTYGNIGVMTTQEMIQKERDITLDCLDLYVSKFAECFDISSRILHGWLSNDGEPDYDEEGGDGP